MPEKISGQEQLFSSEKARQISEYLESIEEKFLFEVQTLGIKEDGTWEENSGFSYRKCDRACFILMQLLNKGFGINIGNGLTSLYGDSAIAEEIGRPFDPHEEPGNKDYLEFVYLNMTHAQGLARAHAAILARIDGKVHYLDPVLGKVYSQELSGMGSDLADRGIIFEQAPENQHVDNWLQERFGVFVLDGFDLSMEIISARESRVTEDDPHAQLINGVFDNVIQRDNQMLDVLEAFAQGQIPEIYKKDYLRKAVNELTEK